MLKPLNKKSKNFIILKTKLKQFIKYQLLTYIIVIGTILLCSWIFNRWIQGFMFCIAHLCIRNAFDKQFHFNKTAYCLSLTLAIIWFAIPITMPLATSLLSSIPIAFLICFFGFIVQDRVELKIRNDDLERELDSLISELKLYKHLDIFKMTEEELRQYGASNKLSETQLDILCLRVFKHLKISEICSYYNYGRTTIKYHLAQIKEKLGITTL